MGRPKPNKIEKRTKHQCLPPTQPYPWLLYFNRGDNANYKQYKQHTFCSISDPNKTYIRSIPELADTSLLTVQYGWCLLRKYMRISAVSNIFFWNPSNLEKINLPNLNQFLGITNCIFSCSPTATDQICFIFLFSYHAGRDQKILFCKLGDCQWSEVEYSEDSGELHDLVNPVYCNGCLYAKSYYSGVLGVIKKLEPSGFEINSAHVFLPPPPNTSFKRRSWLLESNNELYYIQITFEGDVIIFVTVHKLDFSHMRWEKVKSMPDKVFFLSNDGLPFACQAIHPGTEGGRIYFTLKNKKFVHIYNIEDNSHMICHAFSNLPTELSSSFWFKPDLRMTFSLQEEREKTQTRGEKSSLIVHSDKTRDIATNSCAFPFEELNFDIIGEVARCLNVLDYMHFRATNNFFRLRAPPLQWRSLSYPSMSSFDDLSLSPLFVFFEKENILTFVHPKHGIKYKYSINLPEDIQGDCEICYSKDGWLLLAVDTTSNMFFNPFTREVKQLAYGPAPEQKVRNTKCVGISHPPTSTECVVVELHKDSFNNSDSDSDSDSCDMIVYTTCIEKENWEESEFENFNFCLSKISPCFHNEVFYCLSGKGKLGILQEVVEEDKIWKECEKPDAPCIDYYRCFLVECNGSLMTVFEGAFENWVQVFKLDESEMIWTRVENLENHMIFVGDQSFSAVANFPGMENKIYFPRFYRQNIVFYSLETKNYHTFGSSDLVNFHCMKELFNSSWIQPRWRVL